SWVWCRVLARLPPRAWRCSRCRRLLVLTHKAAVEMVLAASVQSHLPLASLKRGHDTASKPCAWIAPTKLRSGHDMSARRLHRCRLESSGKDYGSAPY